MFHSNLTATAAQNQFGACLKQVITTSSPVFIEKHGKPVAVLVDYESWMSVQSQITPSDDEWINSCRSLAARICKAHPTQTPSVHHVRELREDQT